MTYETRITRLTVAPKGEPLFSEQATHIEITDETSGEYLKITQHSAHPEHGEILVNSEEWSSIKSAVETLLKDLRDNK